MPVQSGSSERPETEDNSDVRRLLRESAASFASRNGVARSRKLRTISPGFDRKVWNELAESGWLGIIIPEQFGGQGLGFSEMRIVVEELAKCLAPEPVVACAVFAASTLLACDNESIKQKLLPKIADGSSIVGIAMHATTGTIALDQTTVLAQSAANTVTLNGTIRHVYPALGADDFIVAAKNGGQFALYHVAENSAGVTIEPELRADGTFVGKLTLSEVQVAAEDVVATGDVAKAALRHATDAATILACAEMQSIMTHALDATLDYMRTRVQFGRPIGTFQALQHRAVDLYIQRELSRGSIDDAVKLLDSGGNGDDLSRAASRAKSRCGDAGMFVGRESIKLHGAIGFTDEYDIGLYLRRSVVLNSWLGTPTEHRHRYGLLLKGSGLDTDEDSKTTGPFSPVFLSNEKEDVDWNAFSDREFRAGLRAYIEANYPQNLRNLGHRGNVEELKPIWLDKLVKKGWGAPAWPVEYGGWGLSPAKQLIFIEERERAGVAAIPHQGISMLGPILMNFGTETQKRHYLPKIITNEHVWCQGYSEPNAGSDLASLQTEAVLQGDEWVINGSKIWTSSAYQATHIFVLARTSREGRKQEGISFFIMDIKTPGITVRPIRNLSGHAEFCQEFFENVRIPKENLIGEPNKGWAVAKTLLGFERLNSGSPRRPRAPLFYLRYIANELGLWDDPEFYSRYIRGYLDIEDHTTMYEGFCDVVRAGGTVGPDISALKIVAGDTTSRLAEFVVESAGASGILDEKQTFDGRSVNLLASYYSLFPTMIAAGSNDIQRNILAQRVLNLPMAK